MQTTLSNGFCSKKAAHVQMALSHAFWNGTDFFMVFEAHFQCKDCLYNESEFHYKDKAGHVILIMGIPILIA